MGANFASIYGRAIYAEANQELRFQAKRHGYSTKDQDAYYPVALLRAISIRAYVGRKYGVDGTPTADDMKTGKLRAESFLSAYKALTGNDMHGGRMSGHDPTKLDLSLPRKFMRQDAELRDEGVCSYVQKVIEFAQSYRNGERDRSDKQRGRASAASKRKTRVRERGRGD